MRLLISIIALVLVSACGPGERPNVLIIVMDTVRGDRCSVNGYERPTTPGLGRIAEHGVTFRDAWVPAGWTGPSHASLFTGLLPDRHGFLIDNRDYLSEVPETLAESLAAEGYRTTCLTNNVWLTPGTGLVRGFQRVETLEGRKDATYPTCRWAHREALRTAIDAHRSGKPFFILVNDMEAHTQYTPWSPHQERFLTGRPAEEEVRAARAFGHTEAMDHMFGLRRVAAEQVTILSDLYDAEIAGLDQEVAELVDALEAEGILENTLLVITSDHGENLGDHDLFTHKASLHRTICHVPLVIRMPGRFDGGRVVDDVVRLEDVFPTVLEICGIDVPEGIDGKSLFGELSGRVARAAYGRKGGKLSFPDAPSGADTSLFEVSIRSEYDGRRHRILYSNGREEVYDVKADPRELENLSGR